MGELESPASSLPPARRGNDGLAGTGGADGFGGYGKSFLTDGIGRGQVNKPEDVHQASSFLHANGLLPAPTREATEEFHRGIEAAQWKLNELSRGGLRVDGIARPWGPTEVLSQRAITSGSMRAPELIAATAADAANVEREPNLEPGGSEKSQKPGSSPAGEQKRNDGAESPDRLRVLLDSASRNRREAVDRAARKEAEFSSARDEVNEAWEKVKAEGTKVGLQVGISVLTRLGRPASTGLASAIDAHNRAKERVDRLLEDLRALRRTVGDWDTEIREILSRLDKATPSS